MKKFATISVLPLALCGMALVAWAGQSKTDTVERLDSAGRALAEISNAPDKGIPDEVVSGAKCIAVVPSMLKGGFIVGGKHGRAWLPVGFPTDIGVRQRSSSLAAEAGARRSGSRTCNS